MRNIWVKSHFVQKLLPGHIHQTVALLGPLKWSTVADPEGGMRGIIPLQECRNFAREKYRKLQECLANCYNQKRFFGSKCF